MMIARPLFFIEDRSPFLTPLTPRTWPSSYKRSQPRCCTKANTTWPPFDGLGSSPPLYALTEPYSAGKYTKPTATVTLHFP
ncbi:hypothetical protein HBI88_091560 [Parastagonospora nodorum]|nr:hypothetical protein HBH42_139280 [Parastagonospora nodorum]KAH4233613.1 hypothetical protein HBI06_071330 [Parastagonospora nodorum]KAH4246821.1 hypothetical protein HBI05_054550 [Parastagonospora nodorum]KAH4594328.1 hypothetical protein HBH82_239940 [Parastagonospora nodorum]KAH4659719.1 hypothetical protein HBH78_231780 [Parastagonospora nodorum]